MAKVEAMGKTFDVKETGHGYRTYSNNSNSVLWDTHSPTVEELRALLHIEGLIKQRKGE